ncbi:MAG TPA: hypothetical protein VLV17_07175 [Anaeromyxobacteraceae bacterium]|nr:hypothetical protein [Anaeromyxobacteraceae bacterium]
MALFPAIRRGLFVWARHPDFESSLVLARSAARAGLWRAPGSAFEPDQGKSPWLLNVAYTSPALSRWLTHPSR